MGAKRSQEAGAPILRAPALVVMPTPFGNFVSAIQKRQLPSVVVGFGEQTWSAFPAEDAIAAGLGMVISRVARKLGRELDTGEEDVLKIAERVDRAVNAGLAVKYEHLGEAAVSFERGVAGLVQEAVGLGYRPGMEVGLQMWESLVAGNRAQFRSYCQAARYGQPAGLIEFWQKPAGLFFAALSKAAREYCEAMSARISRLEAENRIRPRLYAMHPMQLEQLQEVLKYFDISRKSIASSEASLGEQCELLQQMGANLAAAEERIQVCRRLPYGNLAELAGIEVPTLDPGKITGDAYELSPEVRGFVLERDWLNTQVLLAAVNLPPGRDYLLAGEFPRAVRALRRIGGERGAVKTLNRLLVRGLPKAAGDVLGLVREAVGQVINREEEVTWDSTLEVILKDAPKSKGRKKRAGTNKIPRTVRGRAKRG